jgi:hypothetical protein
MDRTAAATTAYRSLATLLAMHGHRLDTDDLQFIGNVAARVRYAQPVKPDEIARLSSIRASVARELRWAS